MMNFYRVYFFLFFVSQSLISQIAPGFGDLGSHHYYVSQLSNSKDSDFQQIIELYEIYIERNPSNIIAELERCKFIGNSYYDEYEGYNLKYEETEACIKELFEKNPSHPEVLIYRAESLYGIERLEILDKAQEEINKNLGNWLDIQKASINKMLGEYHWGEDNNRLALKYYELAQKQNKDSDLSLNIAQVYLEQKNEILAREVLLDNLRKDTILWNLNNKAQILLDLGETDIALELFDEVQERDSTLVNNSEMAKAMTNLNNYEAARSFLVKDTVNEWSRTSSLQMLFNHDLKYSKSRTALTSYRSLQKNDAMDDFFAIKRIRLFLKNPFLLWNLSELLNLFFLILSIILIGIIPYLWILPVFNLGLFLKSRTSLSIIKPKLNFKWGLKHFWIISFVYLVVQYLLSLIFYYEESIAALFGVNSIYEESEEDTIQLANSMIFFILFMAIGTVAVLKKNVLSCLYSSKLSVWKSIRLGVGFVIFNLIVLKILRFFVGFEDFELSQLMFSATAEIAAVLKTYGFVIGVLSVAIIGPIYEEIIFRGVILGSVEKHLGFIAANVFQSVLFALVHFNLTLFIYYVLFGLITGYYAKNTDGLRTGIILHALNNFFVLVLIYFFL
ncbi:CPBP family glutamic-type intramembrane protease [Flagellimonas sp. HMM57]|uniref:type II CAAX endopeptidase family protein n=1 Tax=unclassified Flagellimonas TaxID=2644544 RepID=UPI0013D73B86|nr:MULTISPECIES: type II CAAX endopeptidase family protein [unclassified Flagellimonas]UII75760.1 CPBP family glutamic-type intramembrane protease [Flagellimonas sp. HMM57]